MVIVRLCLVILISGAISYADQKALKIVVCSYNNATQHIDGMPVCEKNIRSIFAQTYDNFHVFYVNDCSTDNTSSIVQSVVEKLGEHERFTLINNDRRRGHLYNQYHVITSLQPTDVVCIVDGDDWLVDDHAFEYINNVYQNDNVWLTYGSFKRVPYVSWCVYCEEFPTDVVQNAAYREYKWVSSHIRTFYAGLFKCIDKNDLLYTDGNFWPAAADLAIMFPMLEMAHGRYTFIDKVMYAYNRENPLNLCSPPRLALQNKCAKLVRAKQKYQPITYQQMIEGNNEEGLITHVLDVII